MRRSLAGLLVVMMTWTSMASRTNAQGFDFNPGGRVEGRRPDFHLVDPTGVITADGFFGRGGVTVDDASGIQYNFRRDRTFDSFDGRYVGYWLPSLNRVVRFPRSGHGLMQVTDLDDIYPRYTFSRRRVQPAGHRGRWSSYPSVSTFIPGYGLGVGPGLGYSGVPSYGVPSYSVPLAPAIGLSPLGAPLVRPYSPYLPRLQSVVLDSKIVPRPALTPVQLDLQNRGNREIRVTVIDRANPATSIAPLRIAPGASAPLKVQRDAGADRVQTVETISPAGQVITRDQVTYLPPRVRYELVVHEWNLQSVAIDRTGKSPNVIEDVNFQGRGIGRFELPPGDQLTEGAIDVLRSARQSQNAGSVAPMLDDSETDRRSRPVSDLEEMFRRQREASRQ